MRAYSDFAPLRLGFLYPAHSAEDDYPRLASMLGAPVTAEVVHTTMGEDAHRVDNLLDMGSSARLLDGARVLATRGVAAAMWACTSGSFVFGLEGAQEQAASIQQVLGVPVSSTSLAFIAAAQALGVRRVAIAATYPEEVARRFVEFLGTAGIEVVHLGSRGIITGAEVGTLGREAVEQMVRENDHPAADAVLVPDTALHTAAWLDALEDQVCKTVLTANQVTMWDALRLADAPVQKPGLGSLFRTTSSPAAQVAAS